MTFKKSKLILHALKYRDIKITGLPINNKKVYSFINRKAIS
jgi:hypothetical protein